MALDVARGMAHMHSRNICHGDLCSKNVMLMSSPGVMPLGLTAKIADFGVSRMVQKSSSTVDTHTHGESVIGDVSAVCVCFCSWLATAHKLFLAGLKDDVSAPPSSLCSIRMHLASYTSLLLCLLLLQVL